MLNSLLRNSALLALLGTGAAVAQDEPVADAAVAPVAAAGSGWTVTEVPVLRSLWQAQAVLNPSRDEVAFVTNDESIVYVQSNSGTVTTFNAESGREFWSAQVGRPDEVSLQASSNRDIVVIAAGPSIHGYEKFTGHRLFGFRLPQQPRGGPVITNDSVVVPTGPGSVTAFTLKTLNHLGRLDSLPSKQASAQDWRFGSGEILRFPPVAGRDRVAFVTDNGNIHAINLAGPKKGESQFQFLMQKRATAPLTLLSRDDREYLLAVSADNRLFCIELQTNGLMRWTAPLGRLVTRPVVAVGADVLVLSDDGELSMLDLLTGNPREVAVGARAVVSRGDRSSGGLPSFGAVVEVRLDGAPEFKPFRVANRSTGQTVRSVLFDLSTAASDLKFAVDDQQQPVIRIVGSSGRVQPKSFTVSEDGKQLTVAFTTFAPDEVMEFHADLEHISKPQREITFEDLDGAHVEATVVVSDTAAAGSGQQILGEFSVVRRPWKFNGVQSLVSVSDQAVYVKGEGSRLVALQRSTADVLASRIIPEYELHISNSLTDRVYLATSSGRVDCLAETRIELGPLPLPIGGGLTWILAPESELSPDFAVFHQHPEDRPIMPVVPETDPAGTTVVAPAP